MASSSLPFDLVEDIISRVPIESLIRFKRTSKQWYALCNDKRFIYKHLGLSKKRLMRIYLDKVEIINPATLDLLCLPVPAEFSSVAQSFLMYVIHCNGLLLCRWYNGRGPRYGDVAVWNPVLGQVKFVESSSHQLTDIYGFGYDKNNRDSYKILRISRWYLEAGEFEIYDFKSKLWRVFSATLDWSMPYPYLNVSLNGNMYWIAETKGNRNPKRFIQGFDFSKETFKRISWFPFEVRQSGIGRAIIDTVAISGFRGDRLSLFRQRFGDETREMEVWVTNKVTDGVVLWSKYFNVARPDLPILNPHFFEYAHINVPSFFTDKTDSIVLWCDKVVGEDYACTSFYEIGQGGIKIQVTGQPFRGKGERNPCLSNFVYVPSLVPVPE
ncbi:PREDICTED: putative F-box protein At1g77650 [Camelina sativa]|uniref:F-box protein At1g77650 n=1 Tax=Camelina sativa TaxID=90675 RepID=A0ABM1RLM6_CAMSA|nr:PREDICTED: putative F-box protein At1g77650 [Camelina sativa]